MAIAQNEQPRIAKVSTRSCEPIGRLTIARVDEDVGVQVWYPERACADERDLGALIARPHEREHTR
jgi:hypothetical protein